ncbi:hypothetical protein [Ottowia sp.]|uniref:hypothetical protein n=1 Tax=Ottowia sp. TaxID=1898956 RepID=UPI0025FFED88|nr:hypothetical protein [Ottowia sp.]MBK6616305.1 hypothetical protein [Ottowia sp.]
MTTSEKTAALIAKMSNRGAEQISYGCSFPEDMSKFLFLMLNDRLEEMELAAARGEDCIDGFEDERSEIDRLMDAAPFTMHPDHGCVLKAHVNLLDEAAAWDSVFRRRLLVDVCKMTGTNGLEWEYVSGPKTGKGVEQWFKHQEGREAYACWLDGAHKIELRSRK